MLSMPQNSKDILSKVNNSNEDSGSFGNVLSPSTANSQISLKNSATNTNSYIMDDDERAKQILGQKGGAFYSWRTIKKAKKILKTKNPTKKAALRSALEEDIQKSSTKKIEGSSKEIKETPKKEAENTKPKKAVKKKLVIGTPGKALTKQDFIDFKECNGEDDIGSSILQIADGTTEIGEYALSYAKMSEVIIPNTVKRIGYCAFQNCTNLESVDIPGSVELIDRNAFEWCLKLETVIIREGVKKVKGFAFVACPALKPFDVPCSVDFESNSFGLGNKLCKTIY